MNQKKLKKLYKKANKEFFGGKLPKVKFFVFTDDYSFECVGMLAMGLNLLENGKIWIGLHEHNVRGKLAYFTICHEMVHIWQDYVKKHKVKKGIMHDKRFKKKARKIEKKLGLAKGWISW